MRVGRATRTLGHKANPEPTVKIGDNSCVSLTWPVPWLICVLLGMAALPRPVASAQQQGRPTILYTHAPDGGAPWPVEDIYSIDADGTHERALTNDGHGHHPVWSPDGRRILFVHDSVLQTAPAHDQRNAFESYHPVELYVMNRDGGNRHLLRRLEPVIFSAAWSPDGKILAVACMPLAWVNRPGPGDEPMRSGIFLLPANGQGEPRLLFRNALTPAWSPDGRKLAFSREHPRAVWAVHVANADGSHDVPLTEPGLDSSSPAWSPNGKLIAFDQTVAPSRQEIFVVNADGSHRRQITKDSSWSCEHPSWSPDGKLLVFSCRSSSVPCGMVSSVGTPLLNCERRLFVAPLAASNPQPFQLSDHDGATPAFTPVP